MIRYLRWMMRYGGPRHRPLPRRFFVNGTSRTLAGSFLRTGSNDGPATIARFINPVHVSAATDPLGGAFVATRSSHQIRRIFANGTAITGEARA